MKTTSYASVDGSLMYVQVRTRPSIAFVIGVLGKYLSDPRQSHWKMATKFLRYLHGTKHLILTYWRTDTLEVVGFNNYDYACCIDDKKSIPGYFDLNGEFEAYGIYSLAKHWMVTVFGRNVRLNLPTCFT